MRLIDADELVKNYGLENATKYGNEDAEQQAHSYSTLMLYEIANMIEDAPTIDAVPVVHCEDCAWWEDEHVLLSDGTTRPYTEEEKENCPLGVTADIGINVGSRCMVNPHITSLFRNANDYCSRAMRKKVE